jgi:hypothetical protein
MVDTRREATTIGGEPLWIVPKHLASSFQCKEGQNSGLNRRLPGITQRDILPGV